MVRQPQAIVRNGQIGIHHRTGKKVTTVGQQVEDGLIQDTRLRQ